MATEDFRGQHALGRAEVTRAWVRGETGQHGKPWTGAAAPSQMADPECRVSYDFGLLSVSHARAIAEGLHVCARLVTYAVRVKARDRLGKPHTLVRIGGGDRTLAEAGADYYPTVLWVIEGDYKRFRPGEQAQAWGPWRGPDWFGPYKAFELLDVRTGEDPLGAADTWPGRIWTEFSGLPTVCGECGTERGTAELAAVCCTFQSPFNTEGARNA